MKKGTIFSGKTIGLFLDLAKQKEAILISTALVKKGAKVLVFSEKKKLEKFLWEATQETKPLGVIFDEDMIDAKSIETMFGAEILTVAISFPKHYPPVVVADEGPLNLFLRDLFIKKEVHFLKQVANLN